MIAYVPLTKVSMQTYAVKVTADIAKRFDVNKEEYFSVSSSNNKVVVSHLAKEENKKVNTIANHVEDESSPPSSPSTKAEETDKESYSVLSDYLAKNQNLTITSIQEVAINQALSH